ncbi:MAG: MogA/MoaB family molybdenum cofactor biosynthesis protein [Gemmatimonadota bacterium]|nr:MAG: MogA/MoaB family molybdenum cofactor biosynthesis protein [Gemmatimonadota bacterium]
MIRVAILTVSDGVAAGKREDTSSEVLVAWLEQRGWSLAERRVVPDEAPEIAAVLTGWADRAKLDLVLTTGGTGFGPRDVTPEATSGVLERPAPGLAEALRAAGMQSTPFAALSRGVAGIRGSCLIVNLPGSEGAVRESLEVLDRVVPHAVDLLAGRTDHS